MTTQPRLRYEVWVSKDGSTFQWKRLPHAVYVSEPEYNLVVKHSALERAEQAAPHYAKVVVEEWDDQRDVFLNTIKEYPTK